MTDRYQEGFVNGTRKAREEAQGEIDSLNELLRGTGANRYWEGRWRDSEAECDRLRAALASAPAGAPSEDDLLAVIEEWCCGSGPVATLGQMEQLAEKLMALLQEPKK